MVKKKLITGEAAIFYSGLACVPGDKDEIDSDTGDE